MREFYVVSLIHPQNLISSGSAISAAFLGAGTAKIQFCDAS